MKAGFGTATAPSQTGSSGFVPPSVHELAQLFPQLEILELIGHGGMGAVYKARQPGLDRLVAIKILPPRAGADPGFADRFAREARALAKLNHPNIVAVYDFGQAGGLHYFIMEYVDGPNLRQVEQAGKLSPREALKIIPQICEALQFAHDEGIVHRDIKPENVLLDKKGRVKIADFGLAKILGQQPRDFRLTGTKDVMGTPHYMAPEQVEHPQAVDHRADIYSLGVVLYEMLTGELPLGRFGPPSSRARDVNIDVRLDEVVLRALEREPERRYQQASQVRTDLEAISGQGPTSRTAASAPSNVDDSVRQEIRWPALGLVATGILNWVALPLLLGVFLPHFHALQALPKPAILLVVVMPFVFCSFTIYAGLKMLRLENHIWAVIASVLAMVVTPGNLIGFPVGIWSLVTLTRREVRSAFARVQAAGSPPAGASRWLQPVIFGVAALVLLAGFGAIRALRRGSAVQPASAALLDRSFTSEDKPISGELVPAEEGGWQASCTTTQTFRLFEVVDPAVENCLVTYSASLKTEALAGKAYLEMWCRVSGQGESFSRGLNNTVSGSTDWANCQTPFLLRAGERPDLIRLNLVVEGSGKVMIKDVHLEAVQR